jgi:hypothetical protein
MANASRRKLVDGRRNSWSIGSCAGERVSYKLKCFLRINDRRKILVTVSLLVPNGSAPMACTQVARFEPKA